MTSTRREFLADVGKGMLIASVGADLALDMGFGSLQAKENANALTFGELEPLVETLQETPISKLLPLLAGQWQKGTDLKQLVAAAALANGRPLPGGGYG